MARPTKPDRPTLRATLARGKLYVSPWAPWMAHGGPMACFARSSLDATSVADLIVVDETSPRELIVKPVVGSSRRLRAALIPWAASLGYGRLWLPDEVVALEPRARKRRFGTRCHTCRSVYSDESAEFWESVTQSGMYPSFCWMCGGLMAQWAPWGEDGDMPDPETELKLLRTDRARKR